MLISSYLLYYYNVVLGMSSVFIGTVMMAARIFDAFNDPVMTIFLSDSVDYGEVMNGTREESVIFSMQTFTVKLASGVAVFLAGLVVDWIHLDTAAAVQTQDTLDALRMWMTIPSVILLIVGIFVFKRFYKLDDTRMEEIKSKLN